MMTPLNREWQNTDGWDAGRRHGPDSLRFPALVWPLSRNETSVEYSGLEALGVGLFGCMMPSIGAGGTVRWQAAAAPKRDVRQAELAQRAFVLRAATQVPGLLDLKGAPVPKAMASQFERAHPELDIPRDLLEALFGEHFESAQATTQGSAIAVCRSARDAATHATAGSSREWVLFAGGETKTELWMQPLRSVEQSRAFCAMALTTAIRQIEARRAHPGLACMRTDSMAALVQMAGDESEPSMQILGTPYDYGGTGADRWICDAAWSPWMAPEIALASATGAVRLWDCSAARETRILDSSGSRRRWAACDYWGGPRMLLCADSTTLSCVDFRASRAQAVFLDTKQSGCARPGELITAAKASALHPLHAVVASTHSVSIYDRRYTRQPLLAWALQSPDDPPVRIESAVVGGRGMLFAATREAGISVFEYSQPAADGPFVSGLQTTLDLPRASVSAMQDALAIDPTAETASVRTALEGLAVCTGMHGDTMCLTLDALGGVAGVQLGPLAEGVPELGHSEDAADAHCGRREQAWSLVRRCGVPFERVDLRSVYRYLVEGPQESAEGSTAQSVFYGRRRPRAKASKWHPSLAGAANSLSANASAYSAALLATAKLATGKQLLQTELPSWSSAGKDIYRQALAQDASAANDAMAFADLLHKQAALGPGDLSAEAQDGALLDPDQEAHKSVRAALEQVFGESSNQNKSRDGENSLVDRALDRAAADMALSARLIGCNSERTADGLRDKLGVLPEHAKLLDQIWSGASVPGWSRSEETASRLFASSRSRKAKPSAESRPSLTQPPALARALAPEMQAGRSTEYFSQPIPGVSSAAPLISVPSLASASASSSRAAHSGVTRAGGVVGQMSQTKKKAKSRKSGF